MDKFNIAKSLILGREITAKKTINLMRNYYAMVRKNPKVSGYPSILMVEPTNYCNLRCPLCPTGAGALTVPRGYMKFEGFKQLIDECGDYLFNVTLWNWGEPFLNKDIFDMIDYAKSKRIFVRVSTNGHFLEEGNNIERVIRSGLDELIFSLDGATEETYVKYRVGGRFDCAIENLRRLVQLKKKLKSRTPFIELQFIVMSHNQHEIPTIKKIASEIGVDKLKLKTVNVQMAETVGFGGSKEKTRGFNPTDKDYSRYTEGMIRKEVREGCERLWLSSAINWDGSVSACCNDPNRDYDFGNVFKNDFMSVWKNPRYVGFRHAVLKNKSEIPMCRNCPGTIMGLEV